MTIQLWLPPRYRYQGPFPQPRDRREDLLQRLHNLRVLLPGAWDMELQELEDYVVWQEERRSSDLEEAAKRPANIESRLSMPDRVERIKVRLDWHKRRQAGIRAHYLGVSVPSHEGGT